MGKYTTTIKLNSGPKSRFKKRPHKNYSGRGWAFSPKGARSRLRKLGEATIFRMKLKKIALIFLGVFSFALILGTLWGLSYLQKISAELPSPDDPFGAKDTASIIYDRNGKELYRVFGDENREEIDIDDIPDEVQWIFLATEDIEFYEHPGFDAVAIARCAVNNYILKKGLECGGSTVTQQMVRNSTSIGTERRFERKIRELLLSLQVERKYSKQEILEIYLNVAPFGSNIYGIKTASKFYFGKEPKDLTIAEAAILAGIPQNPVYGSPTIAPDPEIGKQNAKKRQMYALGQVEEKMDKINSYFDEPLFTKEQVEEAKNQEIVYQVPRIDIKAPHFVVYVRELLTQREYNRGDLFTLSDIETGGFKIYTTLDYDMQQIAEENVRAMVTGNTKRGYGGTNGALVTLKPGTGEVLAMVGSKDYWGASEPNGCVAGQTCTFEGKVNIATALNSPGSTAKAIAYYTAFEKGILSPGSIMADVPIDLRGYRPKNSDGRFDGIHDVRYHLGKSRNITAIVATEAAGVDTYLQVSKDFGYTTFTNPLGYGPSIAIGGSDVKMIEHAQGYGVFANGGNLVQHEVVLKIEAPGGDVLYEHKPEPKEVADPRAVYLVNDTLNPKSRSGSLAPAKSFDGRDVAGKTGTSEENKDTWYVMYSPDFVTVGWYGNNNNKRMRGDAFGSTTVQEWVTGYMTQVAGYFPEKTPFFRPGGIIVKGSCEGEVTDCDGKGDLVIDGKVPPSYVTKMKATVCTDQTNRLARDIDKDLGLAMEAEFSTIKMPVESLQDDLNAYLGRNADSGYGVPTEMCDINRNPGGSNSPWAVISKPGNNQTVTSGSSIEVSASGFSSKGKVTKMEFFIGGSKIGQTNNTPYSGNHNVPNLESGTYAFTVKVTDNTGAVGESSVNIVVGTAVNPNFNITSPAGGSTHAQGIIPVTASYTGGGSANGVVLHVSGPSNANINMAGGGGSFTGTWNASAPGTYTLYLTANGPGGSSLKSASITVTITP